MDKENAMDLKVLFLSRKHNPGPQQFEDTDGDLILDIMQVDAVSVAPKKVDDSVIGFSEIQRGLINCV